ncbi:Uncharacterised protein [Mycobacteroides abscessus subsp. abscessus]|nr:Uncharacterised protein [Mycobacteroides abscessus subsp. abscessus]
MSEGLRLIWPSPPDTVKAADPPANFQALPRSDLPQPPLRVLLKASLSSIVGVDTGGLTGAGGGVVTDGVAALTRPIFFVPEVTPIAAVCAAAVKVLCGFEMQAVLCRLVQPDPFFARAAVLWMNSVPPGTGAPQPTMLSSGLFLYWLKILPVIVVLKSDIGMEPPLPKIWNRAPQPKTLLATVLFFVSRLCVEGASCGRFVQRSS